MKIIHTRSLSATVDAINEAFFFGRSILKSDRQRAAKWIAGRQGEPGSYAGMFAPTKKDFAEGIRLFTGESIKTRAGTAHILGEEACRALILLDAGDYEASDALDLASDGMLARLRKEPRPGMYCCGKCSCALWRHLSAGGLDHAERRLAAGMKALKSCRDGKGRWKVFPFYYTLLALSEIDLSSAVREMRYAAPSCERVLKQSPKDDRFAQRRRLLAERILAKC